MIYPFQSSLEYSFWKYHFQLQFIIIRIIENRIWIEQMLEVPPDHTNGGRRNQRRRNHFFILKFSINKNNSLFLSYCHEWNTKWNPFKRRAFLFCDAGVAGVVFWLIPRLRALFCLSQPLKNLEFIANISIESLSICLSISTSRQNQFVNFQIV